MYLSGEFQVALSQLSALLSEGLDPVPMSPLPLSCPLVTDLVSVLGVESEETLFLPESMTQLGQLVETHTHTHSKQQQTKLLKCHKVFFLVLKDHKVFILVKQNFSSERVFMRLGHYIIHTYSKERVCIYLLGNLLQTPTHIHTLTNTDLLFQQLPLVQLRAKLRLQQLVPLQQTPPNPRSQLQIPLSLCV